VSQPFPIEEAPAPIEHPHREVRRRRQLRPGALADGRVPSPRPSRSPPARPAPEIVEWIDGDAARAEAVLAEESDKFDAADVDLLWDCVLRSSTPASSAPT